MAAVLVVAMAAAQAAELAPAVAEAEALWVQDQQEAALRLLEQHLAQSPNDVEALWRKARALYDKGERLAAAKAPVEQRLALYTEVGRLAEQILAVSPGHAEGLFWKGTALGRAATARGILSSLSSADDVERLWLQATRAPYRYEAAHGASGFPADAYYALGQFYRLVPDSSIVKVLTGTQGDIDESLVWLRRGAKAAPRRVEMWKELGVSLLCKAERDGDAAAAAEGRKALAQAAGLPVVKATDRIDHQHIPIILGRADEACTYSRDGWQDLDTSKLKP